MSFSSKIICDACGTETNSKTEVVGSAKQASFTFNQSDDTWDAHGKETTEVVKPEAVTVKIFIECEGKEDFHLCYACLGGLCDEICANFSEECHEDGDC